MSDKLRSCWQNCGGLDDKSLLEDEEILGIELISFGQLENIRKRCIPKKERITK